MAFRFRKSINLGGGFRINLSKSGVGYSWGGKGFRITHTANGKTRKTLSIPGTGLSYSTVSGKKSSAAKNAAVSNVSAKPAEIIEEGDVHTIENAAADSLVSKGLEEMLARASKILKIYKWAKTGFWLSLAAGIINHRFWTASVLLLVFIIFYRILSPIELNYTIEEDMRENINKRTEVFRRVIKSARVWSIYESRNVADKKYSGGASESVGRVLCITGTKVPFPFKSNEASAFVKTNKETLVFLPDKLFIIQKKGIGALNYEDIDVRLSSTRFIESQMLPGDALVIGYTWQYINKSGGPDKRFSNNKKLPICRYGMLYLTSANGLNTQLMFSSSEQ